MHHNVVFFFTISRIRRAKYALKQCKLLVISFNFFKKWQQKKPIKKQL